MIFSSISFVTRMDNISFYLLVQISGIVSPELGAHVLLKIRNKAGFDLGVRSVFIAFAQFKP